jgi:ParB family chromosome partitioning protein
MVKRFRTHNSPVSRKTNPEWSGLMEELQRVLGTKVRIVGNRKRGKIEIEFYSLDELNRILELLRR